MTDNFIFWAIVFATFMLALGLYTGVGIGLRAWGRTRNYHDSEQLAEWAEMQQPPQFVTRVKSNHVETERSN